MYKCIGVATRKAGLSQERFKELYETRHAPLICRVSPELRGYKRNFAVDDGIPGHALDFDAIVELWFDDRAGFDIFAARCAQPEIATDAEDLFDMSKMRVFIVDERASIIAE